MTSNSNENMQNILKNIGTPSPARAGDPSAEILDIDFATGRGGDEAFARLETTRATKCSRDPESMFSPPDGVTAPTERPSYVISHHHPDDVELFLEPWQRAAIAAVLDTTPDDIGETIAPSRG